MGETWSIQELLSWTADYFARQGLEAPRLEAELLLAHALGQNRVWLYTHYDRPCDANERKAYKELIQRRIQGEPYAYITGSREFMSLEFSVNREVLIPRPDTEILVETAIDLAQREGLRRICDVGTGSGIIAVCMAHYLESAQVVASDISAAALAMARSNAERHGAAVELVEADLLNHEALRDFDMILANLPYIALAEWEGLEPGVRDFEPRLALVADGDGLDLYRRLLEQAEIALRPGGWVLFEIDPRQAESARKILAGHHYDEIRVLKDWSGRERLIIGNKAMETEKFKVDPNQIDDVRLTEAAEWLSRGELVAFPTETVYGLGAKANDAAALRKIYRVKGRPSDSGLLVHVSRIEQVEMMAQEISPIAAKLITAFWPGPLAIILDAVEGLPGELTGGRSSLGFRMPSHPLALALIEKTGPLAAPSANLHGRPSPLTAEHVQADLEGKIAGILDGGATGGGIESTIIDLSQGRCEILRRGGLDIESLEEVLGPEVDLTLKLATGPAYHSPVKLLLAKDREDWEQMIRTYSSSGGTAGILVYSEVVLPADSGHLQAYRIGQDAKAEFFAVLRQAEEDGLSVLLCAPLDQAGINLAPALADRIRRAVGQHF